MRQNTLFVCLMSTQNGGWSWLAVVQQFVSYARWQPTIFICRLRVWYLFVSENIEAIKILARRKSDFPSKPDSNADLNVPANGAF